MPHPITTKGPDDPVNFTQGTFVQGLKDDGTTESLADAVQRGTAASVDSSSGASSNFSISTNVATIVASSGTARRVQIMNNGNGPLWISIGGDPIADSGASPLFNGDGRGIYLAPNQGFWDSEVAFSEAVNAISSANANGYVATFTPD